jgi:hypothetical protein
VDPATRGAARSGLAATGNSLARLLGEQLLFEESAATADRILEEIGPADDVESAWLRMRAGYARNLWSDDPADLIPAARSAIPIAERAGERQLLLEARTALVATSDVTDPEFRDGADVVARLAAELERPDVESRAHRWRALAALAAGQDPMPHLDAAAAVAIGHGLDEGLGWTNELRADLAFESGDWDVAMEAGLVAIGIAERHAYLRVAVRSWFVVVPIASWRGDVATLERAQRWFTDNEANFPDSPYGRFMRAGVDLHLRATGLESNPDIAPDRLLPSFVVDTSASWLEAADAVLRRWLADGERAAVDAALQRMRDTFVGAMPPFTEGAIAVMEARSNSTADAARGALARARRGWGPWWIAKGIRLLERSDAASAEELAEARAIEASLGVVEPAP